MYSLLMFAFADEKLAIRVVPSDDMFIFIVILAISFTIFMMIFQHTLNKILRIIRENAPITPAMFELIAAQLDEAKKTNAMNTVLLENSARTTTNLALIIKEAKETNEILSKLVVKKKPNSTDDH